MGIKTQELPHRETSVNLNEVLATLPEDKRTVIETAFYAMEQKSYSGPLPAPEDFAQYEATLPGATDRILRLAERQVEHRVETEKKIVDEKFRQSGLGQWIGAFLVAFFGGISLVLGLTGHDWLAGSIGVTTVLGVGGVFVLNKMPYKRTDSEEN